MGESTLQKVNLGGTEIDTFNLIRSNLKSQPRHQAEKKVFSTKNNNSNMMLQYIRRARRLALSQQGNNQLALTKYNLKASSTTKR